MISTTLKNTLKTKLQNRLRLGSGDGLEDNISVAIDYVKDVIDNGDLADSEITPRIQDAILTYAALRYNSADFIKPEVQQAVKMQIESLLVNEIIVKKVKVMTDESV